MSTRKRKSRKKILLSETEIAGARDRLRRLNLVSNSPTRTPTARYCARIEAVRLALLLESLSSPAAVEAEEVTPHD